MKKIITIKLMGGMGNQMFEYAALRSISLENNADGYIDLSGITNKTHNIFSLNYLNISNDIQIINNKKSIKKLICHLTLGLYYHWICKLPNGFEKFERLQKVYNKLGLYCVPDGFMRLFNNNCINSYMEGYFQSYKYFKKYENIISKELKVKSPVPKKNKDLYNSIMKNNSVCLHIRRGDYIGGDFQVCNDKYYYDAIKLMNEKIDNPIYYVFSDDIKWVKKNMNFNNIEVVFVEKNNKNYEELQLMYSCKNFIISNSSFSYWAQFLCENLQKVVIAPSKWFLSNKVSDIFEPNWLLIDVGENNEKN